MNGTLYTILAGIENFLQDRLDLLMGKFYFKDAPKEDAKPTPEYWSSRPKEQTQPIVDLLTDIGRVNYVDMRRVTEEFLLSCAYEFLDIYERGGKYALLHRLEKIKTMDNLERLKVMKTVRDVSAASQSPVSAH